MITYRAKIFRSLFCRHSPDFCPFLSILNSSVVVVISSFAYRLPSSVSTKQTTTATMATKRLQIVLFSSVKIREFIVVFWQIDQYICRGWKNGLILLCASFKFQLFNLIYKIHYGLSPARNFTTIIILQYEDSSQMNVGKFEWASSAEGCFTKLTINRLSWAWKTATTFTPHQYNGQIF